MKFDTVIIGGGLSGLIAGISLAEAGRSVAIITAGQSSLHFNSGSFDLLGNCNGELVTSPIEAISSLPASHPYSRVGVERIQALLPAVQPLLGRAGIATTGGYTRNRYRLTPLGKIKPTWLSLEDIATFDNPTRLPWRRVAIVNLAGFLDFYPQFIYAGLTALGVACSVHSTTIPALDTLRKNPTEMRAANIARVLDAEAIGVLAGRLNSVSRDADVIVMPAVVGLNDDLNLRLLRRLVARPVYFVSTMPTSVPGVRTQISLDRYFMKLGGTYMLGDTVISGNFNGNRLESVTTRNHDSEPIEASNFIIATGSFIGHGLKATPDSIIEPTMGLDIDAPHDRSLWFKKNIDDNQPFMSFGVKTDNNLHPFKEGTLIENLYACGSLLGGCNPVKEECGAGVSILTALAAAHNIQSQFSTNRHD
ncbi:MAG: glycerol-3-phosphate dehydrogenase subunit GlpB [Bacteroidales bacterium]|nr:glycerol-3-phosphate dehydrogenase subunit GlpB [Bacteroidales bacterium]